MDASASSGAEMGWPFTFRWPTPENGLPSIGFAPNRLWQPINPGWTFGNVIVNSSNSTAPEVEQALVSRFSYGRQIGRLMEAVEALAEALPKAAHDKRVEAFLELAREVKAAKEETESVRLERLSQELSDLKRRQPKEWARIVKGG
jgi:hypothetical protein